METSRAPRLFRAVTIAAIALAVSACSASYLESYHSGVEANRRNLNILRPGMTRAEVESSMGTGTIVDYKKIQLHNPWRTEKLVARDNKTLDILYYVTDGEVWNVMRQDNVLTPLLFENDKLIGWGRDVLDSKLPGYVSGPAH